jgi:DNA primase small subunit
MCKRVFLGKLMKTDVSRTMAAAAGTTMDPKSPEVMTAFYQRLYPFKTVYTWLSHSYSPADTNDGGNTTTDGGRPTPKIVPAWTHREFAFTLQNDAYLRYMSFDDAAGLKAQVLRLVPQRFEVGAIYNAKVHPS